MTDTTTAPTRACQYCGKPLRKPKSGPWGRFCSDLDAEPGKAPCRKQWHDAQRRQERLESHQSRACEGPSCDQPIAAEAHALTRYCSDRCRSQAAYRAVRENPERLARHRERARVAMSKRRAEAEAVYGGRCVVCGETERLEFNHPHEDGSEHRRIESISSMLQRISKSGQRLVDFELQLLCQRHHQMTRVERGSFDKHHVTNLQQLYKLMETGLLYSQGRGRLLRPDPTHEYA